jgi:hypothetical protein
MLCSLDAIESIFQLTGFVIAAGRTPGTCTERSRSIHASRGAPQDVGYADFATDGKKSATRPSMTSEAERQLKRRKLWTEQRLFSLYHSHSMVAGGLLEMSYTTRPISLTELVIRLEISSRSEVGKGKTSAVE